MEDEKLRLHGKCRTENAGANDGVGGVKMRNLQKANAGLSDTEWKMREQKCGSGNLSTKTSRMVTLFIHSFIHLFASDNEVM